MQLVDTRSKLIRLSIGKDVGGMLPGKHQSLNDHTQQDRHR